MEYSELYPRFEQCLFDIAVLSSGIIPSNALSNLEWFIVEPNMSYSFGTNTDLAYELGNLNTDDDLSKAIHCLFIARDRMIKWFPPEFVSGLLTQCELFIASAYKSTLD